MIDSHVNLHHEAFAEDVGAVLERARAAGVGPFLSICDKLENVPVIKSIVSTTTDVWYSVGAHPHYADAHADMRAEDLAALAKDLRVAGIGETGLDLHYGHSSTEAQKKVFRVHIHASQITGLPLIIHTREADELTSAMLYEEYNRAAFPLLLHCYTSGLALAQLGIELGGFISASGIISFRNAHAVKDIFRVMPKDRIIVETDCPYLAPVPHRGRRCEPAFLPDVLSALAAVRDEPVTEVMEYTRENTLRLFSRMRQTVPANGAEA
jgi:TatD DNase family protein